MTAMEIATGILDKLNEQNRTYVESLHIAQNEIKYKERQLEEKDKLIKMLQKRMVEDGGVLEMTNRERELTIKNLELQIEKLLKENEELSIQLEAIKSEICPKCETRLLLRENNEKRSSSKLYKASGKSSGLFETKSAPLLCPNRAKQLERILEHKDKRIMHLSKEVQKLSKAEKELTQKVYRLTKLLPISRLPPEALTECLLKEIQSLESQKENLSSSDRLQTLQEQRKFKKSAFISHACTSKTDASKSSDRLQKSSATTLKPATSYSESQQAISDRVENEVLYKKLQKLCNDINELKRLFSFESEKLSEGLQNTAAEYNSFKKHLEEIVNNLNDVMKSILNNSINLTQGNINDNASEDSDDKYVISCLRKRLKESLEMVTEYENENKALKEKLNQLRAQLEKQDTSPEPRRSSDRMFKTFTNSKIELNTNDASKLKEIIKLKENQLESAQSHINTCQKFIEELQKNIKHMTLESSKQRSVSVVEDEKKTNAYEHENKMLKTKLDVAEKNIKTCENVIEQLLDSVRSLEEENVRIESELHIAKAKVLEEPTNKSASLNSKLTSYSDTCINTLKNLNQELKDKVQILQEANSKLKSPEQKTTEVEILEQEKSFTKSKLEASEKHICTLQKSVETLQAKLKKVELEKTKLAAEVKELQMRVNLVETYEHDVIALKNELMLKEDENKELKESLINLENKTLEMTHYRKSLHEEIESLCKALMESEENEDGTRRKAIYKAAILRSAQALLCLDDDYNFKPEDSGRNSALEELKHQIQVYLTEVARIHELVTIKEHERDELLKEYLDLPDDAVLKPSPSLHHEYHSKEMPDDGNLQSLTDFRTSEKMYAGSSKKNDDALYEELVATKSVANYLLTSCSRLEDSLSKEKEEHVKSQRELEIYQATIKDLKSQLSSKSCMTKRLNTLIEMMRSKECNDEITVQQLKSEIKWLYDENQKIFERVNSTQLELSQCKAENLQIQNDLDSMKRQLLNEKYENAKVNNELKHLKIQIDNSRSLTETHLY